MRAVTWQGAKDIRVETVPDPTIEQPTDVLIRVTTTGLCGSDLHLYEVLAPFMEPGDIVGHEPMGVVEAVGSGVRHLDVGDRIVVPFNISCGHCWMCDHGLQSQCETTQNHEFGTGASLLGYSKLYGQVPGGQAEYLRVPHGDYGAIKVPNGPPDDRFVYLSDVLPTAWQAVEYAGISDGDTVLVLGAGPIGDMAARIALHRGHRVLVADLVPERLQRVAGRGAEVIDIGSLDGTTLAEVVRDATGGRGPDAVIEAVGMEAHGSGGTKVLQKLVGLLPDRIAEPLMTNAGTDRLEALLSAFDCVRRGGTVSIVGVYGGAADPLPMMQMFDKQLHLRMGQANVRRWSDDILRLLQQDDDVLGVEGFATHHLSLDEAPDAYATFQKKEDGAIKIVFRP
ncbi:MAG TPA: zinc-dependent alcohol dehydrogenase [Nocardioides sp.]|uniref:zinc-dependent alcohol dehydrogenase n=1 Tax=uncultured Nocardioides sp. TaxID=198441 RepID=UPI000EE71962|nr:zinc-dependent alcohol dehydrogenase [uncultured Nocardioides sp.]HCB07365.1 glutathione-dependent formaldehyde dehydrogenase [Nocardioides sp.]HRD60214.1 zinc-dependent alcohol dehydrogenase [Nocardioides sp.]HRI94479.1 zinc-dependent alcohol dehydrogenase [Nocardioides sp.]